MSLKSDQLEILFSVQLHWYDIVYVYGCVNIATFYVHRFINIIIVQLCGHNIFVSVYRCHNIAILYAYTCINFFKFMCGQMNPNSMFTMFTYVSLYHVNMN